MRENPIKRNVIKGLTIFFLFCIQACRPDDTIIENIEISEFYSVKKQTYVDSIDEVGVLVAKNSRSVSPSIHGKIAKITPEGTHVKSGDPVVWLDSKDWIKEKDQEQIKLKKRRAQLDQKLETLRKRRFELKKDLKEQEVRTDFMKLKVQLAESEYQKSQERYEKNLIPESDVESAENKLMREKLNFQSSQIALKRLKERYESSMKTLTNEVDIAEAEFEQSKRHLHRILKKIDESILYAPIEGIVIHGQGRGSEKVKVGDQVWFGRVICEIPDLTEMEVETQITESFYKDIELGQDVVIHVHALDNLELDAEIVKIANIAIPRQQSKGSGTVSEESSGPLKVFELTLNVKNAEDRLRPGMGVSVQIIRKIFHNVIAIPRNCLIENGPNQYVIKRKANTLIRNPVQIEHISSDKAMISNGLKEGDIIALISEIDKREANGRLS